MGLSQLPTLYELIILWTTEYEAAGTGLAHRRWQLNVIPPLPYFWLRWIFLLRAGCSLAVTCRLLIAGLLLQEHRLQGTQAQSLWCVVLVAPHGIFPRPGIEPRYPMHGFLSTAPPEVIWWFLITLEFQAVWKPHFSFISLRLKEKSVLCQWCRAVIPCGSISITWEVVTCAHSQAPPTPVWVIELRVWWGTAVMLLKVTLQVLHDTLSSFRTTGIG